MRRNLFNRKKSKKEKIGVQLKIQPQKKFFKNSLLKSFFLPTSTECCSTSFSNNLAVSKEMDEIPWKVLFSSIHIYTFITYLSIKSVSNWTTSIKIYILLYWGFPFLFSYVFLFLILNIIMEQKKSKKSVKKKINLYRKKLHNSV